MKFMRCKQVFKTTESFYRFFKIIENPDSTSNTAVNL